MKPALFGVTGSGEFHPPPFAGSHGGDDHVNGPAVVGLAARTLELHYGSPDFMPTRLTVDLFRAARSVPTAVPFRAVRDGRRVRSAECELAQQGRLVARATLLQYRRSIAPPGRLWSVPTATIPFPPPLDDGGA